MNDVTTWDAGYGMFIPLIHPIPLNRSHINGLECGMVFGRKIHPIPLNLNEINSGMRDDNSPLKGTRGTSSHVAPGGLRFGTSTRARAMIRDQERVNGGSTSKAFGSKVSLAIEVSSS